MYQIKKTLSITLIVSLSLFVSCLFADVKKESTQKMDFKGALGTMMKLFGGEKPVRTIEYLKGSIYRTDQLDKKGKLESSTITDLDNEVFINIDHKKKEYTKMTFAEWKEMLQSGLGALKFDQPSEGADKPETNVQWSFQVNVETPDESEKIAGYNTKKVILTLDVEAEATQMEKGEEKKAKGGLKVVSTNMMAGDVSGGDELRAFQMKLVEKLGMMPGQSLTSVIEKVMQNNPQLGAAIQKLQEESEKLQGVAMRTHTVFETWGESPESDEQNQKPQMPSVGGLLSKFGKKKKEDDKKGEDNVLLEVDANVNAYETSLLNDDLLSVPAKYKEKKYSKK